MCRVQAAGCVNSMLNKTLHTNPPSIADLAGVAKSLASQIQYSRVCGTVRHWIMAPQVFLALRKMFALDVRGCKLLPRLSCNLYSHEGTPTDHDETQISPARSLSFALHLFLMLVSKSPKQVACTNASSAWGQKGLRRPPPGAHRRARPCHGSTWQHGRAR